MIYQLSRTTAIILVALVVPLSAVTATDWEPEEIPVSFEVPRLIQQDIFVQYDGETVYVPLIRVFGLLDFYLEAELDHGRFSGFIISEDSRFRIELDRGRASVAGERFELSPDQYLLGATDLYLRIDQYNRLFDLPMEFNFSGLLIHLPLNRDFPAYQKLQRQLARRRLEEQSLAANRVRRLPYHRSLFQLGAVDWTLTGNPVEGGKQYYNLLAGGMLFGGDFRVSAGGNTGTGLDPNESSYKWHIFSDHAPYLTQVELGDVYSQGLVSRALRGGLITNRPQVERKYFQTITVDGYLGEGWEVELYLDGKLTDFAMTDQNGEYSFGVDVLYGASAITLKMYGPNGEMRTEERYMRIPYNLVPVGEVQYTVAGGQAEVLGETGVYGDVAAYYGLHDRVTIGLSSDFPVQTQFVQEKAAVAIEGTVLPVGNLTLSGSYAAATQAEFNVNYTRLSGISFAAGFSKYFENPIRNRVERDYRASLSVSMPLRFRGRRIGLRFYSTFDRFPDYRLINMNYGFNFGVPRFSMNYLGRYKVTDYSNRDVKSISSQLFANTRLSRWFRPQFRLTYDHTSNNLSQFGVSLMKRIFKTGQITMSYERNQETKSNSFMVAVNLYTGFASSTTRAQRTAGETAVNQILRGSVRYDQAGRRLLFDRRNGVGWGAAILRPFVDRNVNGRLDPEEDLMPNVRARISGAGGRPIGGERLYLYDRLRPYDEYLIEIDEFSIDDPTLKPIEDAYSVLLNPNVVTPIDVPLVSATEVSGSVFRDIDGLKSGLGGITLIISELQTERITTVTTFSNGDFYHLGLVPGSYRLTVDPQQLSTLGYECRPASIAFEVQPGDQQKAIRNMEFLLTPESR